MTEGKGAAMSQGPDCLTESVEHMAKSLKRDFESDAFSRLEKMITFPVAFASCLIRQFAQGDPLQRADVGKDAFLVRSSHTAKGRAATASQPIW